MFILTIDQAKQVLKVLSYWNLNKNSRKNLSQAFRLKVLSYWNLNRVSFKTVVFQKGLKYYHIGI